LLSVWASELDCWEVKWRGKIYAEFTMHKVDQPGNFEQILFALHCVDQQLSIMVNVNHYRLQP
jgi:hypothetical protein